MNVAETATSLFLALAVIVLACQFMHFVCRRIGQPVVVGEMIAGVMLGPSLLGLFAPQVTEVLFPPAVLSTIGVMSQLGLALYMFTVGLEFPTDKLRGSATTGMSVSLMGIAVPMGLGIGFAYLTASVLPLFPAGVPMYSGALFIGLVLAITAFPMLARMISERGATHTRYGTLSLTAGALDDAVAWILLSVVLSVAGISAGKGPWLAGGGFLALLVVLFVFRPYLARLLESRWGRGDRAVVVALLLLMLASWYTDWIGIHAVFGAFALGVVFPRGEISERLLNIVRPLTLGLFLPLFFTFSGLNTDLGLLGGTTVLIGGAALLLLAFIGKLGACSLTAKVMGETWTDSLRIGILMNARGLIQLIALNIALQAEVITPTLFALVVVVAIVTTLFTAPGLALVERRRDRAAKPEVPVLSRQGQELPAHDDHDHPTHHRRHGVGHRVPDRPAPVVRPEHRTSDRDDVGPGGRSRRDA